MISLPRRRRRRFAATSRAPGCGFSPTRRSDEGRQFRLREGFRSGKNLPVDLRLALADEHEAQVREGGEIAARAERAAGRDHRMHAAVQEIQEPRHEDPTDAGVAHRECVRPEQEGGPHLISAQRRTQADRVAPQQVELQRPDVCVGDRDVREFAEARLDPICEGAFRDDLLEGPAARVHARRRGRGEAHRFALAGDGDHVIEVEGPAVDRTHGGPPRHPGSAI